MFLYDFGHKCLQTIFFFRIMNKLRIVYDREEIMMTLSRGMSDAME